MRATAVALWTLWCHALQRHGPAGPCCPSPATNALASLHEAAGTQTPCVQGVSLVLQRVSLLWKRSSSTCNAGSPAIAAAAAASSAHYRTLQTTHLIGGSGRRTSLPGWCQASAAWAAVRGHGTSASLSMQGKKDGAAGNSGHRSSSNSLDAGSRGGVRMAGGSVKVSSRSKGSSSGASVTKASATATAREATAQVRKAACVVVRSSGGRGTGPGAERHPAPINAPLLTSLIKGSSDAPALMQLVERYQQCGSFNHIHAAAALTLFAKLVQHQRLPREQGRAWVARLVAIASSHLTAANTRGMVNFLHAVATLQSKTQLGPADPEFVKQLVTALQGSVVELNGQGLSNTLWALATLDVGGHQAFTTQLVAAAQQKLPELTTQALSNSLWALATLYGEQHSHSHFIQAWVKEAAGRLSDFIPQALSNSLWALATLCGNQHSHSAFIQAWVRETEGRLSDFKPQELSNSLWALSKLGHTDYGFTARVLQAARAQLQGFKTQELSNTALALGTLRYQDPDFMRQLVQRAMSRLPDMTPQALANTLWAMACLNHNDATFVDSAVRHLLLQRDRFNTQGLCSTLWALCILDHSPAAVLQPLLAEAQSMLVLPDTAAGRSDEQPELLTHQRQVYQYLVTMEAQGHISPQLKAQHRQLWEVCQAAWAEQLQQEARASFTQRQVLQAVRELPGCEGATCEQLTEDGLLSIDVVLQLQEGGKVALEVDGPTHFMANAPDVPNGSTLWRNHMLQLRGWQVVSVPVVEWSRVGGNAEKQRSYLLQRFAQEGVQLPCNTSSEAAESGGRRLSVVLDPRAAPIAVAAGGMGDPAVEAEAAAVHFKAADSVRPEPQAAAAQGQSQPGLSRLRRCSKCGQLGHSARTCSKQ